MAEQVVAQPGGCRWCGLEKRIHFQRWTSSAGWHGWTQPTTKQIKQRMKARRIRGARASFVIIDEPVNWAALGRNYPMPDLDESVE